MDIPVGLGIIGQFAHHIARILKKQQMYYTVIFGWIVHRHSFPVAKTYKWPLRTVGTDVWGDWRLDICGVKDQSGWRVVQGENEVGEIQKVKFLLCLIILSKFSWIC